ARVLVPPEDPERRAVRTRPRGIPVGAPVGPVLRALREPPGEAVQLAVVVVARTRAGIHLFEWDPNDLGAVAATRREDVRREVEVLRPDHCVVEVQGGGARLADAR